VVTLDHALRAVSRLGIDTAPIVYLIERHPRYHPLARAVFERLVHGQFTGVTSVITLGEVLVQPLVRGDAGLQQRYRDVLLQSVGFDMRPIDAAAAEHAAELRARYRLRLPDALQLAVVLQEGCEAFLTNDRRLQRVTELRILVLDDVEL
jgi:predicted nucleic acid-binding protein